MTYKNEAKQILKKSLKDSKLLSSSQALVDFENFELDLSTKAMLCDDLLSVYRGRASHLQSYKTEHAIHLRRSTEEFCANLEQNLSKECYFYTLKGEPKQEYLLVLCCETNKVLGCLKVISKLKATDEEWILAWGH